VDDARLELQGGGAGIVDLLRGTIRQAADGWALAVADRRTADLGGLGEWADVAEEMDLFALRLFDEEGFEFSVPRAWQQIARLLAAAERATLGDQGVPQPMVQLNVRPPNSVLPANILLSAAVTGGELPRLAAQYLRGTEGGTIPATRATIRRRGAWLYPTPDEATTTALAAQQIQTISFTTAHDVESPLSLTIRAGGLPRYRYVRPGSRLLIAETASAFTIVEAENLANGTTLTSQSLTAARGGAYLRALVNPAGTALSNWTSILSVKQGDVYALVRNPSAAPVTLRVDFSTTDGEPLGGVTPERAAVELTVIVPADSGSIPIYVGRVDSPINLTRMRLVVTTTIATEALRIDSIVIHRDQGPCSAALEWPTTAAPTPYGDNSGSSAAKTNVATIENVPLSYPAPLVYLGSHSSPWLSAAPLVLQGDPYLQTRGQSVSVLPLICSYDGGAFGDGPALPEGEWVPRNNANTAALTYLITARRQRAYLIPE
jgi:hypothetical protein